MSDDRKSRKPGEPETTGHVWDEDLQEYNNPLPRWWLWIFYATIIWGVGYTIAYPAWPGIKEATPGLLGYSSRAEVAEEIAEAEGRNAAINERLASVELPQVIEDPDLRNYATQAGAAVFRSWCSQCHGSGAAGVQAAGYPNLLDDAWLWGGTIEDITYTIRHGIRNEEDPDARWSQMPAYGTDEILSDEEIVQVVNYVMTLSGGTPQDAAAAEAGAETYEIHCAACHGAEGGGDPWQGAPALNDAIWLYGGDYDTLLETVTYSRFGIMPPWANRLEEHEIRAVAAYVHQLGGGEASPE
jgi:cytochrome c oxidase cbb3-type subunit 3